MAALLLIPLGIVGFEYMPPVDRGEVFVTIQLPDGNAADADAASGFTSRVGCRREFRTCNPKRRLPVLTKAKLAATSTTVRSDRSISS